MAGPGQGSLGVVSSSSSSRGEGLEQQAWESLQELSEELLPHCIGQSSGREPPLTRREAGSVILVGN